MRVAVSSDQTNALTRYTVSYLRGAGHEVRLFGALRKKGVEWVESSSIPAEQLAKGRFDEAVLFCWTGTGAAIVANKIPGVRAALCTDAEQARGARRWDHANVLVMSLQLTSSAKARKILDAWFSEGFGTKPFDLRNVARLHRLEMRYLRSAR